MDDARLACPACAAPLTAEEVLEACTASDPETGLLRCACPRCGAPAVARLGDGRLEIGRGTPSGFRPSAGAAEPDLYVRREAAWVDCWHRRIYRRFPVGG